MFCEKLMNIIVIISIICCIYSCIKYIINMVKMYMNMHVGDTYLCLVEVDNHLKEESVMIMKKKFGIITTARYDLTKNKILHKPRRDFFPLFILNAIKV